MAALKEAPMTQISDNEYFNKTLFCDINEFPFVRIERFDYLKVPALVGGGTSFPCLIERDVIGHEHPDDVLPNALARMFQLTGEHALSWSGKVYYKTDNPYKSDRSVYPEVRNAQWYHCGNDVTQAVWGALSSDPFQQTLQTLEDSIGEFISGEKLISLPGFKHHSFGGYRDITLSFWEWTNHPILDKAMKKNPRLRACDLQIVGGSKTAGRETSHAIRQDIAFIMYEGFLLK